MNGKIIIMAALLIGSSISHAGFECKEAAGLIKLTAEHEDIAFEFRGVPGKLVIVTSGKDEVQMSTQVGKWSTRVGSRYAYTLPVDGISFSVSEFTNLVKNPDCYPGGRITCDYDWNATYDGYLTFNGKSYVLACQTL